MENFLGEIRLFPYDRIPKGWLPCEGQLLPLMQNTALYSLLGTVYGGDGKTNFALPDLRGRVPMHVSPQYRQGTRAGEAAHSLTVAEMPTHTHTLQASNVASSKVDLAGNTWALTQANSYKSGTGSPLVTMNEQTFSTAGTSQPHNNMQPYLAMKFCIATVGIFPPRD